MNTTRKAILTLNGLLQSLPSESTKRPGTGTVDPVERPVVNVPTMLNARETLHNLRVDRINHRAQLWEGDIKTRYTEIQLRDQMAKEQIDALTMALELLNQRLFPPTTSTPPATTVPDSLPGKKVLRPAGTAEQLKYFKPSVFRANPTAKGPGSVYTLCYYTLERVAHRSYKHLLMPVLQCKQYGSRTVALACLKQLYEDGKVYRPDLELKKEKKEVEG